jgi:hypothetical protein
MSGGDDEQRDVVNRLLLCTWHCMRIERTAYWFKCAFDESHCWLLFTDLASVWYQRADAAALQMELAECNGNLKLDTHKLLARLETHLTGSPPAASAAVGASSTGGAAPVSHPVVWQFIPPLEKPVAQLLLFTKIGQLNFKWCFKMTPMRGATEARDLLSDQLVLPLFDLTHAYERRIMQLSALVRRRDSYIQEKLKSGLPVDLRKVVDDEQLERDILERYPPSDLPATAFKSDTFGERAFTQRLKNARDAQQMQRAQEREAKRARMSQQQSASVPSDGSPLLGVAAAAVADTHAAKNERDTRKAHGSSSDRARPKAVAAVRASGAAATSVVAAVVASSSSASAVARPVVVADSVEEAAEELERRRELEDRLERERKVAQAAKAAQQKKRALI